MPISAEAAVEKDTSETVNIRVANTNPRTELFIFLPFFGALTLDAKHQVRVITFCCSNPESPRMLRSRGYALLNQQIRTPVWADVGMAVWNQFSRMTWARA